MKEGTGQPSSKHWLSGLSMEAMGHHVFMRVSIGVPQASG